MDNHRTMPAGAVRELGRPDFLLFRDHLLRLDPSGRRDRFNGVSDDEFVAAYAARCFEDGTSVIAHVEDGAVRGAAEIHECVAGRRETAEIAFSVEEGWQRRGLGSRLFERLVSRARALGYRELRVTTHPQNEAMKALARRFGARLTFENLETVGLIELGEAAGTTPGATRGTENTSAPGPAHAPAMAIPAMAGDGPAIVADAAATGREGAADALSGLIRAVAGLHRAAFGLGREGRARR